MAVAAVFGGPTFNLLVSMGAPLLYATAHHGPLAYAMSRGVVLLGACTLCALCGLLVAVPWGCRWRLPRALGAWVLGLYAASQVVFLLTEERVL